MKSMNSNLSYVALRSAFTFSYRATMSLVTLTKLAVAAKFRPYRCMATIFFGMFDGNCGAISEACVSR